MLSNKISKNALVFVMLWLTSACALGGAASVKDERFYIERANASLIQGKLKLQARYYCLSLWKYPVSRIDECMNYYTAQLYREGRARDVNFQRSLNKLLEYRCKAGEGDWNAKQSSCCRASYDSVSCEVVG
jgi:hypothetical protein